MNRLVWIVTLPIALLVILFALMNRQEVTLSLWPLPWDIGAPLFLFTLGAIVFGFLFGSLVVWVSAGNTRRKLRAAKRALADAQGELAILKRQASADAASLVGSSRPSTALPPPTGF